MMRSIVGYLVVTLAVVLCTVSMSFAQETNKPFGSKGGTELGGSIGFQSVTSVYNGNTGSTYSIFTVAPFIGYFITDGFELGLNPLGLTVFTSGGRTTTQFQSFLAPSYNFRTEGIVYPFAEALIGYTSVSSSNSNASENGFSYGARGGVKIAVTHSGLLNVSLQYLQITQNPDGAENRYGSNQLTVSAGFTIWL